VLAEETIQNEMLEDWLKGNARARATCGEMQCTPAEIVCFMRAPIDPHEADRLSSMLALATELLVALIPDERISPEAHRRFHRAGALLAAAYDTLEPISWGLGFRPGYERGPRHLKLVRPEGPLTTSAPSVR
jgi:hypothetical protein